MQKKQVDKEHYQFSKYITKRRWASMWHQLDEVLALEPSSVLEIGPGPGVFKALAGALGVQVETLDLDPELEPDHVSPAEDMPFMDNSYDVVCAFQMLEHVPYNTALAIFAEMCRIAIKHVVISLPDAQQGWPYSLYVPKKGDVKFFIPLPLIITKEHVFDGEHYWEINKKGYRVRKVNDDLEKAGGVELSRTYRVKEFPYHRFFIYQLH